MATKSTTAKTLDISLLGRNYAVAFQESEREALLEAAAFLEQKMSDIKGGGKVVQMERIAVMTALNLANELLTLRKSADPAAGTAITADRASDNSAPDRAATAQRLSAMQSVLREVLQQQPQ
jgi:cell division protein ZapA